MISEMIKNKGMNCVGASTSEMVLSELRKNRFDIIFADIHLETISGIDLIKDIKKIDSNILNEIPIIILSATSDLTKSSLISYGFTDFLAKPFNSVDLYKMINLYTNAGLITGKEEKQHSKGIHSLIEYVKDDEKLSVEILESFINETVGSRNLLENSFQQNNYLSARQVSHKIYPLIKMIGDNQVISMVKIMESGNKLTKDMEMFILAELNRYIEEAEQLKDVIITKLNEQK
jgi:DNA-binding response OmpR family regulator